MSESLLVRQILLAYGTHPTIRLFRNNVGVLRDKTGAYITYGLCPGSSDIIGWSGGIFVAIEVKMRGKKPTPEQVAFILAADRANCIAGVVYSLQDVEALLGPPTSSRS